MKINIIIARRIDIVKNEHCGFEVDKLLSLKLTITAKGKYNNVEA